jgi:protein-S-isoprenylcysteine O-methyltransferase Ste14
MGGFGVVLMVLGVALAVVGVVLDPTMPADAPGRATDLHPISLRPMLTIVGGAMVVAGALFLAVARVLRRAGREMPWVPVAARAREQAVETPGGEPDETGERPP